MKSLGLFPHRQPTVSNAWTPELGCMGLRPVLMPLDSPYDGYGQLLLACS